MMEAPIFAAVYGSSPKVSGYLAHSGCNPSPKSGAKIQGIPAARVSFDVTRPAVYAKSLLKVAARVNACGNKAAFLTKVAP